MMQDASRLAFRTLCASHVSRTRFLDVQGCIDNHLFWKLPLFMRHCEKNASRPWLLLAMAFLSDPLLISLREAIIQECSFGARRIV